MGCSPKTHPGISLRLLGKLAIECNKSCKDARVIAKVNIGSLPTDLRQRFKLEIEHESGYRTDLRTVVASRGA